MPLHLFRFCAFGRKRNERIVVAQANRAAAVTEAFNFVTELNESGGEFELDYSAKIVGEASRNRAGIIAAEQYVVE